MPEQSKYPWDDAPEWAQWAATDSDGVSYFYETEPYISSEGEWMTHCLYDETLLIYNHFEFCDKNEWQNSLEKRPVNNKK